MQMNPEPVAPFFDAILVGEAEVLVPPFLEPAPPRVAGAAGPVALLASLARLAGAYVPSLYDVETPTRASRAAPG